MIEEDNPWIRFRPKGDQFKLREELRNNNMNNMFDKLKSYIPLAILVLLSGIIIFWAVMTTIQVKILTNNILEDRNALQQIVVFLQQLKTQPAVK